MEEIRQAVGGKPLEIWFADEARVGQKNKIARRWARRGTRPRAPHDQRTSSVYIFGAICPQEGKGATSAKCRLMACVSHRGRTKAAPLPSCGQIAPKMYTELVR